MSADPRRDLSVLRSLTEQLSDGRSLEDALRAVTDAALELLPGDHASIRLVDASRTQLLSSARSGKGSDKRSLPITKGEGVAGWVLEHGIPAHVKNTKEDPRFMEAVGQGFSIGSILGLPLLSSGKSIGVLSVSSPTANAFSDDDAILARLLANCSVPPIERARLERLAATDELTLSFNARYLLPRLHEEIERARASSSRVSVVAMTLDRMQQVHETFGRDTGDRVLCLFVERVRAQIRPFDVLVRTGDDAFVLIMPQTEEGEARTAADSIAREMEATPMEPVKGGFLTQTVSIGVSTWDGIEAVDGLHARAHEALRRAKPPAK
jgi:two-component system cell cycle response regulator